MKKLSGSISLSLSLLFALGLVGCATTQQTTEEPAAAQTRPAPRAQAPADDFSGPGDDAYTVRSGDHLWGVSGRSDIYGDPYRWPLIYKANQNTIQDADLIYPGQVLTITRGNTPFEIEEAIHHARTRGAWSLGVVEDSDVDYLEGRGYAASR